MSFTKDFKGDLLPDQRSARLGDLTADYCTRRLRLGGRQREHLAAHERDFEGAFLLLLLIILYYILHLPKGRGNHGRFSKGRLCTALPRKGPSNTHTHIYIYISISHATRGKTICPFCPVLKTDYPACDMPEWRGTNLDKCSTQHLPRTPLPSAFLTACAASTGSVPTWLSKPSSDTLTALRGRPHTFVDANGGSPCGPIPWHPHPQSREQTSGSSSTCPASPIAPGIYAVWALAATSFRRVHG